MDSAMSWLIIYSYIDIFGCMNVSKNIDEYKYISWRFTFNKTEYCVAITGQSQLNWDTNRRIETIWEGRSESGRSDMHAHIQKKKQREREEEKRKKGGEQSAVLFFLEIVPNQPQGEQEATTYKNSLHPFFLFYILLFFSRHRSLSLSLLLSHLFFVSFPSFLR